MTTIEQPDATTDLRTQAQEASAEVARISEAIVAGSTEVTAADLIAAEETAERLRLAAGRQAELEREGNLRRQAERDRKDATALAASMAERIVAGGGIRERLDVKQAAVRKAVAELVDEVDSHNATVEQMLRQVAAVRSRVNLADFGLVEIDPRTTVGVVGVGHLGKVDATETVAAAIAKPLAKIGSNDLTNAVASRAGSYERHIGDLVKVASQPATREQQIQAQERRRVRGIRKSRQVELEGQLRAIRSGLAAATVKDLDRDGAGDTIPTNEEAFKAKFPDFVEGASHYEGPLR